jgi:hypothetical protein
VRCLARPIVPPEDSDVTCFPGCCTERPRRMSGHGAPCARSRQAFVHAHGRYGVVSLSLTLTPALFFHALTLDEALGQKGVQEVQAVQEGQEGHLAPLALTGSIQMSPVRGQAIRNARFENGMGPRIPGSLRSHTAANPIPRAESQNVVISRNEGPRPTSAHVRAKDEKPMARQVAMTTEATCEPGWQSGKCCQRTLLSVSHPIEDNGWGDLPESNHSRVRSFGEILPKGTGETAGFG